jgi:hypothetical protein
MVECKVNVLILYHHTNTVSTELGSFRHTTQTQCVAAKEPGCGWPWPGQPAMLHKATLANAPCKTVSCLSAPYKRERREYITQVFWGCPSPEFATVSFLNLIILLC